MTEIGYAVLDVFAERRFEGNQLAVFGDGTGLTDEQMQTIAREMNLSETVFVLPRAAEVERERGVRVRIFTTEEELPFAGHPTLGTATWLRMHHAEFRGASEIVLEENVGPIPVRFRAEDGRPGMFATMRQNDPEFGAVGGEGWPTRAEFAEALGVAEEEIGLDGAEMAPVQVVSTGSAFCVVPLRSMEVMGRLAIPQAKARPTLARVGARFFYCVTRVNAAGAGEGVEAGEERAAWHGRMQFYNGEDPATGSAAGCVAAWLVAHGLAESGARGGARAGDRDIAAEPADDPGHEGSRDGWREGPGDGRVCWWSHHFRGNGTAFPAVIHEICTEKPGGEASVCYRLRETGKVQEESWRGFAEISPLRRWVGVRRLGLESLMDGATPDVWDPSTFA